MAFDENIRLADATLGQYTEVLIRGNGFGHESLWIKVALWSRGTIRHRRGERSTAITHNHLPVHSWCDFFEEGEEVHTKVGETYYDDSGEVAVTFETLETDLDELHQGVQERDGDVRASR
jgi:hypothetical protein